MKGRTENELPALDRPVFVVRPGSWSAWLFPVLERLAPKYVTTTEHGDEQRLLRSDGINRVAG
ncbi:hypothetical protein [Lentzea sp. CC55]|uniref:hypothetical protein n=1 Tax=Lentzea sp. CC55 TaxID=2884909 RepID=UPI001F39250F|nr:hypothetical protein [Lentzea sp. CC55]MCG8923596.1 hypothetical protein [Lentzea sp. CC55]